MSRKLLYRMLSFVLILSLLCAVPAFGEQAGEETLSETPEPTEEPIIVDELVDVDNLMLNEELDEYGWWNILLLGSDSRSMGNYYGLADTIVILSVHPEDNTAKLTSIMRDTWVKIYNVGERKINSANVFGGPELMMRTINEHFGMNISNYVLVSMQALTDIIDAINGIDITVTEAEMRMLNLQMTYDAADFTLNDSTPLSEFGEGVHVTGNQALAFARIRKLDSDYVRTERQRNVLIAIAEKLQEVDANTLITVVTTLCGFVDTNLSISQVMSLANVGISVDMANLTQLRLPADGTYTSDTYDGVWSIRPDFAKNAEILKEFIYGAE